MTDQSQPLRLPPTRHHLRHIVRRTLAKSWDDSIFSESAQAAFWCALSLPPLLLGMLGSLAYVAPLFGPETLPAIQEQLISTASALLLVQRRQRDHRADGAGHREGRPRRGGVDRFRDLAVGGLVGHLGVRRFDRRGPRPDAAASPGAATVLRAGPVRGRDWWRRSRPRRSSRSGRPRSPNILPDSWDNVLAFGYYPLLFLTLVARGEHPLPGGAAQPLPSHRLALGSLLATVVFLIATLGLRFYLTWITSTGYTYGALATPIAFLLFAFFLGLRDHARRRTQRRCAGGVAGARDPREAAAVVAGGEGGVAQRDRTVAATSRAAATTVKADGATS